MKEEYKEFIGIYDESVPVELCDGFVKNWEEAKNNRTLIDLTKENETLVHNQNLPHLKKRRGCICSSCTIYYVSNTTS